MSCVCDALLLVVAWRSNHPVTLSSLCVYFCFFFFFDRADLDANRRFDVEISQCTRIIAGFV
jgi:hypothetical protein